MTLFLWFYRVITTVEGLRGLMFAKTPHNCNSISRHHCLLPSNVRSYFDKLIWRRGKCFIFLKWNNVLVEIPLDAKNVHWSWNINLSSLTRPVLFLLQTGSHDNDSEKTCQTTACQEVIWYHGRFPVGTIATLFSTRLPLPPPLPLLSFPPYMSNWKVKTPPIVMNAPNQQSRFKRHFIAFLRLYCVFKRVFIA